MQQVDKEKKILVPLAILHRKTLTLYELGCILAKLANKNSRSALTFT